MACLNYLFPVSYVGNNLEPFSGFGSVQMCPKFTTSIAQKTISYYLLKNVPLKESILEVSGHVWTRDASIWSTLRLLF